MGALMRTYDWSSHPLGNPAYWPQSLKANVRLMLNSGFPMFIWWTKELYMFNNDAYLPALGKKHPKALGARAQDMWAEIWEQIGGITKDILEHGNEFYAENLQMFLERKGFAEETYWTFSYSPAFNDAGEVEGIFCACSEVTTNVLAQRRLKTLNDVSDALLQVQTLEQAGQTACHVLAQNQHDLPFSLIYLINGTDTEAQLVGKSGTVPAGFAPQLVDLRKRKAAFPLAQVQRTRQRALVTLPSVDPSLPGTPAKAVILPILRPGHEQLIGFFVAGLSPQQEYNEAYKGFHSLVAGQIATSITGIRTKQELLRRQEYLSEIFQQAPVGITMLRGPQYIVDIANPAVCEIWRISQEEILGKPVLEAIPEAGEQGFKELLDGVMNTGVPFVANELPLVLERNGKPEKVYLNFVYHPLRDAQGFITGIIAVAIDISEQVEARQEMESINRELLATNADLDNFVYSASHDLKAPIYNIEGLVHALQEHLPHDASASEEVQQLLTHIESSVERFKKVVSDLTQVAKIQREGSEDVSAIDLEEVMTELREEFELTLAASEAQLETDLTAATIRFSAKNIRSILYNLLSNALKYRSPERKPHITVKTVNTPEHLVLSVTDNGLGIEQSDYKKVFSMFKRLHDHVEGSGIGLYIVKRIVENAGGYIRIHSEVGKGTTFSIYFKR
ncbi:PAS domain-containing sensor histidine kinase [Pontibacter actiniarum]|uniref:histidine kinase n=2 Tax=Pontibacter actiniarum TaxID=323450 RepID=A0A1X9YY16_9BACT|nr:PAS domain-containing sensor histidine kinase [Pontibacter actiniarum]